MLLQSGQVVLIQERLLQTHSAAINLRLRNHAIALSCIPFAKLEVDLGIRDGEVRRAWSEAEPGREEVRGTDCVLLRRVCSDRFCASRLANEPQDTRTEMCAVGNRTDLACPAACMP